MSQRKNLWKKRIAFVLSAAMLTSQVCGSAQVVTASDKVQKTVQQESVTENEAGEKIPENVISLNDEITEVQEEEVNASPEENTGEDIPILHSGYQENEVEEQCVDNSINAEAEVGSVSVAPVGISTPTAAPEAASTAWPTPMVTIEVTSIVVPSAIPAVSYTATPTPTPMADYTATPTPTLTPTPKVLVTKVLVTKVPTPTNAPRITPTGVPTNPEESQEPEEGQEPEESETQPVTETELGYLSAGNWKFNYYTYTPEETGKYNFVVSTNGYTCFYVGVGYTLEGCTNVNEALHCTEIGSNVTKSTQVELQAGETYYIAVKNDLGDDQGVYFEKEKSLENTEDGYAFDFGDNHMLTVSDVSLPQGYIEFYSEGLSSYDNSYELWVDDENGVHDLYYFDSSGRIIIENRQAKKANISLVSYNGSVDNGILKMNTSGILDYNMDAKEPIAIDGIEYTSQYGEDYIKFIVKTTANMSGKYHVRFDGPETGWWSGSSQIINEKTGESVTSLDNVCDLEAGETYLCYGYVCMEGKAQFYMSLEPVTEYSLNGENSQTEQLTGFSLIKITTEPNQIYKLTYQKESTDGLCKDRWGNYLMFDSYSGNFEYCEYYYMAGNELTLTLDNQKEYSLKVEKYQAPVLSKGEVIECQGGVDKYHPMLVKVASDLERSTLWVDSNVIGYSDEDYINYASTRMERYRVVKYLDEDKNPYFEMWCEDSQYTSTEATMSYTPQSDSEYYLMVASDVSAKQGDIILGKEKDDIKVMNLDNDQKGSITASMMKCATIKVDIKEPGFYYVTANGQSSVYTLEGDSKFQLYPNQKKLVYLDMQGENVLRISRELNNGASEDEVTFTLEKTSDVNGIEVSTSQDLKPNGFCFENSNEEVWYEFKPSEDGSYFFELYYQDGRKVVSNYAINVYEKQTESLEYCYYIKNGSKINVPNVKKGCTYYVKLTGWKSGMEGMFYVTHNTSFNMAKGQTEVEINLNRSSQGEIQVSKSGLYRVTVTGNKKYYMKSNVLTATWKDSMVYLSKGTKTIYIYSTDVKEGKPDVSNDTVKLKIERFNDFAAFGEINVDKEQWVKYVPEKTGYYTYATLAQYAQECGDYSTTVKVYNVRNKKLYSTRSSYITDGIRSVYMYEGKAYYFRINTRLSRKVGLAIYKEGGVVYESMQEQLETTLTFNKLARLGIENITKDKYYWVTVTGNTSPIYVDGTSLNSGESLSIKLWAYEDRIINFVNNEDLATEQNITVKIWPVQTNELTIKLSEEIERNQASIDYVKLEGTPEENKSYCWTIKKDDWSVEMQEMYMNVIDRSWYQEGDKEVEEILGYLRTDGTSDLEVVNMDKKTYSVKVEKANRYYAFDYDRYRAYLASGGTVNLVADKDMKEDYDWRVQSQYRVGDGYTLVVDSSKFKNQKDIWLLYPVDSRIIRENQDTYADVEKIVTNYNMYNTICQGFVDEKGQYVSKDTKFNNRYYGFVKIVPKYVPVKSIDVLGQGAMQRGSTQKLKVNIDTGVDYEASNGAVLWKSSDTSVLSVDANGTVKALKNGRATITCTSVDNPLAKDTFVIVVSDSVVYVKNIKIKGVTKVKVGKTTKLSASLETGVPESPSTSGVIWSSSDRNIATVSSDGTVKGINDGIVTITAKSKDGKAIATVKITVEHILPTKIKLNETKITLKRGSSYKWLKVTYANKGVTDTRLTWKSKNTKVATVDRNGVIKGKAVGSTTITVTTPNGKKASVKVTVTAKDIKVKSITCTKKKSLKVGKKYNLAYEIQPINATNGKVKFKSSNPKVATVNSKGVVTAKKKGSAVITITSKDGGKKQAKCKITVKN